MYLCQVCQAAGRVSPGRTVDHRIPKSAGGTDDPSNLQTICDACHRVKTQGEAARGRGRPWVAARGR
ncbi:HNH endonuclease [Castellaniella sp. UC4442_H9]